MNIAVLDWSKQLKVKKLMEAINNAEKIPDQIYYL
jgi:hypothetical protein